ncbi:hypothetical protein [Roseibium polysiphoniae]|uniref:Uncharacterized protein n=1 Tax=Roseibium polysiphoniae TaxID=2571221 RepID=A0ABR9C564_9HYPH|nr:hypothetical protein [Roseibium polysiphoniae]MBD8875024.1 hypothetical protein [Roseibium polysiphoniae]
MGAEQDRSSKSASSLDGSGGRLVALAIAISCLALMVWLGREDVPFVRDAIAMVTGKEPEAQTSGNPELDACLSNRVGDIDQLLAEGMIKDSQYPSFKRRATSYCETQFPAGG